MSEAEFFFVHEVQVETYEGETAYGPTFAVSTPVAGYLEEGVHLVRDVKGDEVTSMATFFCSLADADKFPPKSRVTVTGAPKSFVIARQRYSAPGTGIDLDHAEIHLT